MAEDTGGEKNLPASGQKRQRAREEGNVAKSQDLSAGAVLALALLAMMLFGRSIMDTLLESGMYFLGHADELTAEQVDLRTLVLRVGWFTAQACLPVILVLMAGGIAMNLLQVGFLFTTKPLQPNLSRLNPLSGFSRFVSARSAVELIKSALKVALVAWVVYLALRGRIDELPLLMGLSPWALVVNVAQMVVAVWWRIALVMLVLGIFDYGYQWWQHERDLRMTHREAREEAKEMEGDPNIKRRIRQMQRQIASQRMMKDVPKADVIITNPTHYAVALQYDMETMASPVVTAKGARLVAQRIRELGVENDVPIVQKPELARALFRTVEIGQPIPENLFHAVAEVLSFVYRIDRRESKRRERKRMLAKAS